MCWLLGHEWVDMPNYEWCYRCFKKKHKFGFHILYYYANEKERIRDEHKKHEPLHETRHNWVPFVGMKVGYETSYEYIGGTVERVLFINNPDAFFVYLKNVEYDWHET